MSAPHRREPRPPPRVLQRGGGADSARRPRARDCPRNVHTELQLRGAFAVRSARLARTVLRLSHALRRCGRSLLRRGSRRVSPRRRRQRVRTLRRSRGPRLRRLARAHVLLRSVRNPVVHETREPGPVGALRRRLHRRNALWLGRSLQTDRGRRGWAQRRMPRGTAGNPRCIHRPCLRSRSLVRRRTLRTAADGGRPLLSRRLHRRRRGWAEPLRFGPRLHRGRDVRARDGARRSRCSVPSKHRAGHHRHRRHGALQCDARPRVQRGPVHPRRRWHRGRSMPPRSCSTSTATRAFAATPTRAAASRLRGPSARPARPLRIAPPASAAPTHGAPPPRATLRATAGLDRRRPRAVCLGQGASPRAAEHS